MAQAYSNPKRENDPHALPDLEVFYVSPAQASNRVRQYDDGSSDECTEPGWYWWACFPGCLPDGEASGPFATEAEALADARDGIELDDDDDASEGS